MEPGEGPGGRDRDSPAVRLAEEYLSLLEREEAPGLEEFLSRASADDRDDCRGVIEAALRIRGVLAELRPGRTDSGELPRVPGFRILEEVGRGGLGIVYAAWDAALERKVALKVLRRGTEEGVRERILEEARRAAGLKDPAIITIHSVVEGEGAPAIVMEYVEGYPLDRAAAALTFRQKARILYTVARALSAAHAHGIIHRDLKPGNVLVTPGLEPKILDFGLAISSVRGRQGTGEFEGTPLYASPEQTRGSALTTASDVFSFGSVLFTLLTGRPPFDGSTREEVLEKISTADPPFPRSLGAKIPEDLQAICLACLARDPAQRPRAEEVAADLGRYLAGEPARLRPALYGDILRRRITAHQEDLRTWCSQGMISEAEGDRLQAVYRRILEDEDHWIVDSRKVSLTQALLYTGNWMAVVAAVLLVWLARGDFVSTARWLVPALGSLLLLGVGLHAHRKDEVPASASFLAGSILSAVPAVLSLLAEMGLLAERPAGVAQLLESPFSNLQLLAASLVGAVLSSFAWRRLRLTGFAWTTAALAVASYLAFLLTRDWLDRPAEVKALWCLPLVGLEGIALLCEGAGRVRWALPFHLIALVALVVPLDVMAVGGRTFDLLGLFGTVSAPGAQAWMDSVRKECFAFALNGLLFLALMLVTERARSLDLRRGSRLLEVLALLHLVGPLYSNARSHEGFTDAAIYLAVVLAILLVGPWKNRARFLMAGLLGIALGSHLLIDLHLVSRPVLVASLGIAGLIAALATYAYLARHGTGKPAGRKGPPPPEAPPRSIGADTTRSVDPSS